jgi:hypothetical protein
MRNKGSTLGWFVGDNADIKTEISKNPNVNTFTYAYSPGAANQKTLSDAGRAPLTFDIDGTFPSKLCLNSTESNSLVQDIRYQLTASGVVPSKNSVVIKVSDTCAGAVPYLQGLLEMFTNEGFKFDTLSKCQEIGTGAFFKLFICKWWKL